jgi:predicted O-linked N-acetylglucosamine transferase (SPINDLY family)
MSSKEVSELIRRDQIDILVELTGHTAGNRLDVMAHKPAPICVTWIGYPNTTGLPTVDYRITDEIADPSETKQEYVESLVRLPGSFLCYSPPQDAPEVSVAPCVQNGTITFGSFNNLAKVNDKVISIWCTILKKGLSFLSCSAPFLPSNLLFFSFSVPGSRFLMKCKPFACVSIRKKFLERFEAEGVETKRIDLLPLLPTTSEHLSSYSMVDVSLDTYPYAGTTTTCESLFCGVPVVTYQRVKYPFHAHNVGASLLSRIKGMEKFIATSESEVSSAGFFPVPHHSYFFFSFLFPTIFQYIDIAIKTASDLKALAELRKNLRSMMLASSLCDGKSFVKGLEDVYAKMWKKYCDGGNTRQETKSTS